MSTYEFKTKSEILNYKMPRINGNNQHKTKTIIALDGGYSAVKGVSPSKVFKFPSYAKKIDKPLEAIGEVKEFDIQFINNKTEEIWLVGQSAMSMLDISDIEATTDASLFTRYRYDSDIYKAIMSTGLAIGALEAEDSDIYVQTGLPATYKERDEQKIINALAGEYDISIKIGANPWRRLQFNLPVENIYVMEQPQGTLCGCAYTTDGISENGKNILKSNTIIFDVGFETEDIFSIKSGYRGNHQTYSDTGMRATFEETLKELARKYPIETKVFELQNYLTDGIIPYFDYDDFCEKTVSFEDILLEKNKQLCDKSIRRLMQEYDNLRDYNYLIVTGGTGECRYEQIKNMLKGLPRLKVLPGNINYPDLSFTYSNVLGYYAFRHAALMKAIRKG